MNETKELAKFITQVSYRDLNNEVVNKTKGLIIDQLGCQMAFATTPWGKAIYEYVRSRAGDKQESTVAYYGLKTLAEDAALANAVFGHGFEMDDTEMRTITHPGSVVIPAVLATGEARKANGEDLLTAIVAGYEAMIRVGMAARAMVKRSFHSTGVVGPFGAAAAAGKILKIDTDTMLNALGIAGSEASGVSEYSISGGSVKRLHAGSAAQSGVRAAILAQMGITGPSTVLEGKKGFCQAFADGFYPEDITADLGGEFRIMWTGNKPYCCCAAQHTTIDATAVIMSEHPINPDDVEEITVTQAPREGKNVGNIIEPQDIVSAQFSGRFGVALRLVKGSNGYNDYSEQNLRDPKILALVKKINYIIDEEFEKVPLGMALSVVTIKLKDGNTYNKRVEYAKGTLQNPMTKPELEDKFRGLASMVLPDKQVESIIQTVADLERIKDISLLTSLLAAKEKK
jgi:2-methylcitrate dehydratase PrpD